VPVGKQSTAIGGSSNASQQQTQLEGKRKTNELASSGLSSEPAGRRPAQGAWSAPSPARHWRRNRHRQRHISSPEGRATYEAIAPAAVAAATAAQQQQRGPLMPTAEGSDPFDLAVWTETAPMRMSTDIRANEWHVCWHH
jgi:hypothetical protein